MKYEERECLKLQAYNDYRLDSIYALEFFEKISLAWWHRQTCRVTLTKYRCHIVRAKLLNSEPTSTEILNKYPPSTGKLKIAAGMSDYCPNGLPAKHEKQGLPL